MFLAIYYFLYLKASKLSETTIRAINHSGAFLIQANLRNWGGDSCC
ncbi:hypothetical protein THF5H11_180057 [Vibrio jasicida]|nr:hypothetical protein THF5H11_180057 [Vibrio jasicida]